MQIPQLNIRTSYSLLSSLITFNKYFNYAIKLNLSTLAICDNNMFGVYEFHQLCQKNKIKPIIGLNINIFFNNLTYNISLFANNQKGYFNLIEISSLIMNNTKNKIILTLDKIDKFLVDNIKIIINYSIDNFKLSIYQTLKKILNNEYYLYLGINNNNLCLLSTIEKLFSSKQIIWNNKIKYFTKEDFITYKIINTIKKHILFNENKIQNLYSWETVPSICQKYFNNIEIFISTINIFSLHRKNEINNLLRYPAPNNKTAQQFLYEICYSSLKNKKIKKSKLKYLKRLNYELDIINKMDFNDYFLIVWDYVSYAKQQNIFVGPGRGSATGSLVSYLLNITTIDPIKYNLLFERFLNLKRKKLPDIDVDFEDNKREKIIKYLFKKYGKDHIAYIITFQTFGMKIAIRDICRIFNIEIEESNKINEAILLKNNFNYEQIINSNNIFEIYQKKYPQIFLHLKKIVDLPRQTGTHAAGIILTKQRLQTIIPIKKGNNEIYKTQYSINNLEKLGILKIDLLGLKSLTILHNIIDNIYQDKKIKIDINNIPLKNQKTYKILSSGDTKGIFQLESHGITNILINIIPKKLEDIIVASSLYRPSACENISLFIKRKKTKKIHYINKQLWSILKPTFGVIVYQEQIMLIAKKVANFSLTKSDIMRNSIEKKDIKIIEQIKNEFIKKAIKNNYQKKTSEKIWELICKFTKYGFNRGHAVAYSLLSYQMAYLKTNYPLHFFAALLTHTIGDTHKTNDYIILAKKNNIIIIPPNINQPYKKYITINNKIYSPLLIIKQINIIFFNKIIKEYKNNGLFLNLYDLFIRLYKKGLNYKTYEALCFSGSLDNFKMNRISLFSNYQRIVNYVELIKLKEENEILIVDISLAEKPELIIEQNNELICLKKEYEFLGFYLSNNPLKYIRDNKYFKYKIILINNLKLNLKLANILILVKKIKIILDKNNNKMAFLECYDESNKINIIVFSKIYKNYSNLLKVNNILILNIKLEIYNNKINGILNKIKFININ